MPFTMRDVHLLTVADKQLQETGRNWNFISIAFKNIYSFNNE